MKVWKVIGWDGTEKIYEDEFQLGIFSENQIVAFLQRLVCRHLTPSEIASCTRRRRKHEDHGLLTAVRDSSNGRLTISVGNNPCYTATSFFSKSH